MTKKITLIILLCMMLIALLACSENTLNDYFFVEIMANSEKSSDTLAAKKTASGVYSYLAVILNDCDSLLETENAIYENLHNIEYISNEILSQLPVCYNAHTQIKEVERNLRQCGNAVIRKGKYKTLIITLGQGGGDTHYSVVYPSLSYVEGEKDIILKSKIYEIMEENKKNAKNRQV
ncbi:MAG: hypothetical protein GX242_02145 [Clostridiales bacterium]|nr:hypothetical protein [Clostridiales bacterium]